MWDGRSLLDHEQAAEEPYTRYEAAEVDAPPIFVHVEGSPYLRSACPEDRVLGTHTVAGRTAARPCVWEFRRFRNTGRAWRGARDVVG